MKKAAERARIKANPEPVYEVPNTWADFKLTPELMNLKDGQQFLQHDSGSFEKVEHSFICTIHFLTEVH